MLLREPSMAKTLSWFDRVKRFCSCHKKPKAEKQTRKWRTWVAGKLKYKQCPALLKPERAVNEAKENQKPERAVNEAKENQKKYALTVAMATAAAAEAAVAAVQAAAEVVRLTAASRSHHSLSNIRQVLAATNIQSAFRGYLARKALRALKGVVRLQAIVRGQAVRRQMAVNMKNVQDLDRTCNDGDNDLVFKSKEFKEEGLELEHVGQRSWDYSILTKEAIEALWSRKQEAAIKRKRMMKYSFSHRERSTKILHGPLPKMEYGRTLNFIEQWADKEAGHRRVKNLKPIASSNTLGTTDASYGPMQFKLRSIDGLSSPASCSRRSFARRRESIGGHDTSVPNSPSYMAATQSTMAKTRSMSTTGQRIGHLHGCFDHSLAYEDGMSYYHSSDAELLSSSRRGGHCPVKLLA